MKRKIESLPILRRVMRLELVKRAADPEDDPKDANEPNDGPDSERFDISISSETPVARETFWGDSYHEILDHGKDAVNLDRAAYGLPFLNSHDSRKQVGMVEGVHIGKDKMLRGTVRFSRSADAQDVKRDLADGIRPFISVGYRVHEMQLEASDDEKGDTYRVLRWSPMEVSSVSMPADMTVGVGRSESVVSGTRSEGEVFPVLIRSATSESQAASQVPNPAPVPAHNTEVRMDAKTVSAILQLARTHGITDTARVDKWIAEERTVEFVSSEILTEIAQRGAASQPLNQTGSEHVELSAREQREYSLVRGINMLVRNEENKTRDNCFELELSEQLAKTLPDNYKRRGGLIVPWKLGIDHRKAMDAAALVGRASTTLNTTTSTKGAEVVFTEPGEFIEFLYAQMKVKALGARTLSGLQGNIAFPRMTGRATGSWVAENPGSDVADSNLTLGQILMSPHTYQSSTGYTRQLLAQSVIDIDNLVRSDMAKDVALALDAAAIAGTGANNQPTGILSTSGTQAFLVAADAGNGGVPAWADIVKMETLLETANADQLGAYGWLTTPGIKGVLKLTARLANTIALPVWSDNNTLDGSRAEVSNQVPKTLVKGTSSACHAIILGIWDQLLLGLWGSGFELIVDP